MESVSAFDAEGRAVIEVRVVNTGTKTFFLPISTAWEARYGHPDDDNNRDFMLWSLRLRSSSSEETVGGAVTYRSSTDPQEAMELRPQESVLVRFQVNLRNAGTTSFEPWLERLRRGEVVGAVEIRQTILKEFSAPEKGLRFNEYHRDLVLSNYVPVFAQPR